MFRSSGIWNFGKTLCILGTGNNEIPAEELIAWKDLYPIIDRLYDNFYTRLMEHFGSILTDKEIQTCCLLCAGFSTKEIAVITRQASSTVYFRKTSTRQKMGAPDGADIVEWVTVETAQIYKPFEILLAEVYQRA